MHQPSGSHLNCFFFALASAASDGTESTTAAEAGAGISDSSDSTVLAAAGTVADAPLEEGVAAVAVASLMTFLEECRILGNATELW